MKEWFITTAVFIFLTSCISLEPLTLDNTFDKKTDTTETDGSNDIMAMRLPKNRREIIHDRFSTANLKNWYTCNDGTITISDEKRGMTIRIENGYNDCFGVYFYPIDIRTLPVLKIKASIYGGIASDIFDLTFILQDKNGKKSSVYPTPCYPDHVKFKSYYFDLEEFLYKNQEIDAAKISNLVFFINTRGGEPASGTITIHHMEFTDTVE